MNWFFYAFIAMLIQGLVLFIVKLLSSSVHPLTILFFQYIGSLIAMGLYLIYKRISFKIPKKQLGIVLFSGFLVSTGLSFYYLSIGLQNASIVVPLHNIGITLIPVILAFAFLKEKSNKRTLIGIVCSIICIILLTV